MDTLSSHELQFILSCIDNERDLCAASLVCKLWNAATVTLWFD